MITLVFFFLFSMLRNFVVFSINYNIAIIKWHEYNAIMNNAWASRAVH